LQVGNYRFSLFPPLSSLIASLLPHRIPVDTMSYNDETEFRRKLVILEKKTELLKRMRKITNELKSNGAYSTKNMEVEHQQLEKVHTKQEELDILGDTWVVKKHLAKALWKELDELNKLYKKTFMDSDT